MAHTIQKQRAKNPMWLYEHNYATLASLFPSIILGEMEHLRYALENHAFELQIKEKNKYTLLLQIKQQYSKPLPWGRPLTMRVRIYTDANVAEVVGYQGRARFHPRYDYPNPRMYHRDEKWQVNHLLYDWLMHLNRYFRMNQGEALCI